MPGARATATWMAAALDDLFASPDHYLHSFDGDAAIFVSMDRVAYHRSIFLDGRISPAASGSAGIPVRSLVEGLALPSPTSWIFHIAHCGSTLLARALDSLTTNLVLREPQSLRQLALAPDAERLKIVTAMLSKRYRTELPTVVKANVPVNFLLPDLITFDQQARAVFLYLGLRDYLLAILRNDGHREWLRRVTGNLATHLGDLTGASDAVRAAALWSAQMRAFAQALQSLPNARSLDAEAFFAAPHRFVRLVAERLAVPLTDEHVDATVNGPLFATYSKNPTLQFNNEMRMERRAELERTLARELEQAQLWAEQRGGDEEAMKLIFTASLSDVR